MEIIFLLLTSLADYLKSPSFKFVVPIHYISAFVGYVKVLKIFHGGEKSWIFFVGNRVGTLF